MTDRSLMLVERPLRLRYDEVRAMHLMHKRGGRVVKPRRHVPVVAGLFFSFQNS
jgi:hypothetical protein